MRRRSGLSSRPIEFLPRRFFFVVVRERSPCSLRRSTDDTQATAPVQSVQQSFPRTAGISFVSLHEHLPNSDDNDQIELGLPQTLRFNAFLTEILGATSPKTPTADMSSPASLSDCVQGDRHKVHYFFVKRQRLQEEIRAIHLICRWRLLCLHLSPHEALAPFEHLPYLFSSFLPRSEPFEPPNLLGSLAGIAKGMNKGLLGTSNGTNTSRSARASRDTVDTGIQEDEQRLCTVSQRFVLFSGHLQAATDTEQTSEESKLEVSQSAGSEKLVRALKHRKVSLVVLLDKKPDDASTFAARGLEALDLASAVSLPTTARSTASTEEWLIARFLEVCESTEGLLAMHNSSSSGRVSAVTCIGCYLMKHLGFTSQEAVGWLRFCRPGAIPLAWELFLDQMQPLMWLQGEHFRRAGSSSSQDDVCASSASDSLHINIGKISLGRVSLLGTKLKERPTHPSVASSSVCRSSRQPLEAQQSTTTAATATAQLKRRPLTQGSAGSRRLHRGADHTGLRADYALMHRFLHQSAQPAVNTRVAHSPASDSSAAIGAVALVPSRPKSTAPAPNAAASCTETVA